MSFRIRKLPKDDRDMQDIVREVQEREAEDHVHEHSHEHEVEERHEHAHAEVRGVSSEDLINALVHVLEHQLGELAQINERSSRISRSIEDLVQSMEEIKNLLRSLIKLQIASLTDNREIKRKIIEDVAELL
ncbi:MAG: hypothetical protein QW713_02820 [Sulfolobales archaeon]